MSDISPVTGKTSKRQYWMSVLSRADVDALERHLVENNDLPSFDFLRKPETGLIMMRARAGGSGQRFNFAEATMTRCSVSVEGGYVGHGYVLGRNKRHAEIAALLDAILQSETEKHGSHWQFIRSLASQQEDLHRSRSRKVASTKVNFLTLEQEEEEDET